MKCTSEQLRSLHTARLAEWAEDDTKKQELIASAEDEASTLEPQAKRLLKAWLEKMQAKRKAKQALAAAAKKEGSI